MTGQGRSREVGQSLSYESFGRVQQKHRTRSALKAAAAELVAAGRHPTIVEVAAAARVSKSTAYRYFPSRERLLAEVLLDAAIAPDLEAVFATAEADGTAAERLDRVVCADHRLVGAHEAAFRTALQAMAAPPPERPPSDVPRRPGNRLRYLSAALAPLAPRLGDDGVERLVAALALCVGIESTIVTEDICGLTPEAAEEVKRWAAAALLREALSSGPPRGRDGEDGADRRPSGPNITPGSA